MSEHVEINKDLKKYLQELGYRKDTLVDELVSETKTLGNVARMQIAKEQGQFLEIIVKISNAKSCLEIGRFTGLSTLYMARGLPKDGQIVTVDTTDEFLPIAKKYWDKDDQASKIKSIIGAGTEVMQSFIDRQYQFDIIFIDADKNNYPNYYELALSLVPSNGIIIIDNMLWHGDVADSSKSDSQTQTIRELNLKIRDDKRVDFSLNPLSDGLLLIRKK
jgi:Predicted O-methyltransferase